MPQLPPGARRLVGGGAQVDHHRQPGTTQKTHAPGYQKTPQHRGYPKNPAATHEPHKMPLCARSLLRSSAPVTPKSGGEEEEKDPKWGGDQDDEYKWAGLEPPKVMVTTSRDPSARLRLFAKVGVVRVGVVRDGWGSVWVGPRWAWPRWSTLPLVGASLGVWPQAGVGIGGGCGLANGRGLVGPTPLGLCWSCAHVEVG
uniref:Uncharacterized protein n=1 Tax=Malurus cyaneus samueli TaxID=2593467 RepID=A0A8C5TQS0_9PASS